MKYTIIPLIILLLLAPAFAQNDALVTQIDTMADQVEGQELAGPVGTLLGNQHMNIEITLTNGGELVIGLITDDKIIMKMQGSAVEDPSLIISLSEATVQKIQNSVDPNEEMKTALLDGRIKYQALGFFNKIKFKFVSTIVKMFSDVEEVEDLVEEEETEIEPVDEEIETESEEEVEEETNETTEEETEEVEEELVEVEVEEETEEEIELVEDNQHTVVMDNTGFSVPELTVKVGDTVTWENTRSGSLTGAMVIGARFICNQAKSPLFKSGGSYSYTFEQPGTCVVVDGIMTTQAMNVIVEE
ncbi:MAG: hypothetical protein KKH52_00400 [Nanoarchaeota archaeon]|nr:hypothetical protein [Nanoarchaeota archaeon]